MPDHDRTFPLNVATQAPGGLSVPKPIDARSRSERLEIPNLFRQIIRRADQVQMIFHNDVCVERQAIVLLKKAQRVDDDLRSGGISKNRQPVDNGAGEKIRRRTLCDNLVSAFSHARLFGCAAYAQPDQLPDKSFALHSCPNAPWVAIRSSGSFYLWRHHQAEGTATRSLGLLVPRRSLGSKKGHDRCEFYLKSLERNKCCRLRRSGISDYGRLRKYFLWNQEISEIKPNL